MKRTKNAQKVGNGKNGIEKKNERLRLHFMPNSHLDREWGMDFQQTRKLTVDFIDALLEIFKQAPEYTFILDSQTAPLEDYLEIRPEKRGEIKRLVREKRLSIGPWYTAPDCNTIAGESIIRNLLIGHKIAKEFGGIMKIGYTPFGFGQVSQLPQIYNSFGIDTALFYRYMPKEEAPKAEFLWESPDGTVSFCSRFGIGARYNFFFYVWKPVLYKGKMLTERIADWKEGGVPFKFIDKDNRYENYWMDKAVSYYDEARIMPALESLLKKEMEQFSTPAIALMQGMDTSKPDIREYEIFKIAQKGIKDKADLFFSNFEDYMAEVRKCIKDKNIELPVVSGERRHPGGANYFTSINSDIISARVKQKQLAKLAETILQRWAEPFAVIANLFGEEYPAAYLETAWKNLLQCHAHDTVGGCGIDDLEKDAEYRLRQVVNISKFIRRDAMAFLQRLIANQSVKNDEIVITVFNPLPYERSEVVRAFIDIPENLNICHIRMYDSSGSEVSIFEGARRHTEKVLRANADAANSYVGEEIEVLFFAENIPALGYKTFIVKGGEHSPLIFPQIAQSPNTLLNKFVSATINADGTIDLEDKKTGKIYRGLNAFEDGGEAGDPWNFHYPSRDRIILSKGCPVEISLEENSHLSATVKVSLTMQIPAELCHDDDYHLTYRSERTAPLKIISFITLRKDSPALEFETHVENNSKNHRLRVLFPAAISTDHSHAEQAFDVVSRDISRSPGSPYSQTFNPTLPLLRFVDKSDGENGFAIITKGLHEYEAKDDEFGTVALTLLRCFEITLCTVSYRWERLPEMELSQCLGKHVFNYAVYPHSGNWDTGGVFEKTERYHLPVISAQSTANVSDVLPQEKSFLSIFPSSVQMSALKKSEDGKSIILRLFNPYDYPQSVQVKFGFGIKTASIVLPEETIIKESSKLKINDDSVSLDIPKKKFMTVRIDKKI